jgi:hypothetical protein
MSDLFWMPKYPSEAKIIDRQIRTSKIRVTILEVLRGQSLTGLLSFDELLDKINTIVPCHRSQVGETIMLLDLQGLVEFIQVTESSRRLIISEPSRPRFICRDDNDHLELAVDKEEAKWILTNIHSKPFVLWEVSEYTVMDGLPEVNIRKGNRVMAPGDSIEFTTNHGFTPLAIHYTEFNTLDSARTTYQQYRDDRATGYGHVEYDWETEQTIATPPLYCIRMNLYPI